MTVKTGRKGHPYKIMVSGDFDNGVLYSDCKTKEAALLRRRVASKQNPHLTYRIFYISEVTDE